MVGKNKSHHSHNTSFKEKIKLYSLSGDVHENIIIKQYCLTLVRKNNYTVIISEIIMHFQEYVCLSTDGFTIAAHNVARMILLLYTRR